MTNDPNREQPGCLTTLSQPSCFGFLAFIGLMLLLCSIADITL
ncbi:hypothetical protein [Streptomyces sp. NPDC088554]